MPVYEITLSSMPSPKTAVPSRSNLTSLMYSLPVRRLKEILSRVVPDSTLGPVEEIATTQLPRLYSLSMSDEKQLLLSLAPSLTVRLLRQEGSLLSSEATLVYFIASMKRRPAEMKLIPSNGMEVTKPLPLSAILPKLLKHSSNNREMAYPYSIFEPTNGAPLSTISIYLNLPERRSVDKQVGYMVRSLASLTSPSGTFGTVSQVLVDPFKVTSPTAPSAKGLKSWSEAFNTLLEGILRDGEDLTVLLPYEPVRDHCKRLSWRLDAVTIPRLVILDAGSETNVMVDRGLDEQASSLSSGGVKLTGLRSWSQGVFGDPLLCDAFEIPSDGFLEGWREGGDENLIEDETNANVRVLLYRCYRAIMSIVAEHYRPQVDSSKRELEGRRKLTSVLAELEIIDIVTSDDLKRVRSLSGETTGEKSSLKRQKLDEKDV